MDQSSLFLNPPLGPPIAHLDFGERNPRGGGIKGTRMGELNGLNGDGSDGVKGKGCTV